MQFIKMRSNMCRDLHGDGSQDFSYMRCSGYDCAPIVARWGYVPTPPPPSRRTPGRVPLARRRGRHVVGPQGRSAGSQPSLWHGHLLFLWMEGNFELPRLASWSKWARSCSAIFTGWRLTYLIDSASHSGCIGLVDAIFIWWIWYNILIIH